MHRAKGEAVAHTAIQLNWTWAGRLHEQALTLLLNHIHDPDIAEDGREKQAHTLQWKSYNAPLLLSSTQGNDPLLVADRPAQDTWTGATSSSKQHAKNAEKTRNCSSPQLFSLQNQDCVTSTSVSSSTGPGQAGQHSR